LLGWSIGAIQSDFYWLHFVFVFCFFSFSNSV
jgi:hypothetical protein